MDTDKEIEERKFTRETTEGKERVGKFSFTVDPLLWGLQLVMPVATRTRSWTLSRLGVLPDGTTMPVLRYLAREVFGQWDDKEKMAYWKDKDWTNEVLSNVALCSVTVHRENTTRKYGIPSGSAEYRKKWMEENKEKVKESQRKYQKKRREAMKALKEGRVMDLPEGRVVPVQPYEQQEQEKPQGVGPKLLQHLEELVGGED